MTSRSGLDNRHCERSEAIHKATKKEWIASSLRSLAMTIDTGKANGKSSDSRGYRRRSMPVRKSLFRDRHARALGHDHSAASRRAHGAAYATYVGSWRKRFRVTRGKTAITRFEDTTTRTVRSFCGHCGTPLFYERARSPHMVNIPRALFSGRTGRQPLYHVAIEQLQEWAYTGEPLVPLKGFPGVVWQRSKKKKPIDHAGLF
jgi:hypothetical protein